jgi:hypothetical protein
LPLAGKSCQTEVDQFMVEGHKRIKGCMQTDQRPPQPACGLIEMAQVRPRIGI